MTLRRWVIATVAMLLLGACGTAPKKTSLVEPRLEDVVAAVHVAIRDLSTSAELQAINEAANLAVAPCAEEKSKAKEFCAAGRKSALEIACKCASGSPPACQPSQPALCSASLSASQADCNLQTALAAASRQCTDVSGRGTFVFKKAEVTLSVTKGSEKGGELKLFIFNVGGKKGAEDAQTIVMELKPLSPGASASEASLPKKIVDALVNRVNEALKVAAKQQFTFKADSLGDTQVPAQAWMSDLKVSVALSFVRSTSGGIAWEVLPVGVGASRSASTVGVSKVDFIYGIDE